MLWLYTFRLIMSKEDKEGYIVQFVGCKGPKTEYAIKAYEVNYTIWLIVYTLPLLYCLFYSVL